jgi:hypothetical protein
MPAAAFPERLFPGHAVCAQSNEKVAVALPGVAAPMKHLLGEKPGEIAHQRAGFARGAEKREREEARRAD